MSQIKNLIENKNKIVYYIWFNLSIDNNLQNYK